MSSETRSSEQLTPLLDNINDFMVTVLSPLPESSSLISCWNRFRPLLSSNNSNSARVQDFLTELEPRGSSSRNTFLSGKSLVDLDIETLKKYLQQKQAITHREIKLRTISEEQDSFSPPPPQNHALRWLNQDMSRLDTQGSGEEERKLQKVYSTPQLLVRNTDTQKDTSFYYDMNDQSFSSRSGEAKTAVAAAQEVFIVPISSYQHCPSALEFVARVMNKPISQVTNYEFYESFYVFEGKNSRFSFYHCLVLAHFLHSFAHKTTSLWLSSLFEKIVFHKDQLSLYPNKENIYESLTSGLKSLIQEKVTRPNSSHSIQELFLNMFFSDSYFREGLVIVLKEFVIGHMQELDYCEYTSKFHGSFGHVSQFISTFRKAHIEPTPGIHELFSKILDGCIDIHSVKDGRIEAKLYNSEGIIFKEQKIRLVSVESVEGMKGKAYHIMVSKEQAELISRVYSSQNLKGTVYYSMESSQEEEDLKSRVEKKKEWILKGFPITSSENQMEKTPRVRTPVTFNRDLLLQKARQITNKMSDHSNELKGVVDNLRRQKNNDGLTPRNRPEIKYTSPFSPSININGGFKTPTAKIYETPFTNIKNKTFTNLNATFSSEKCKPAENLNPRLNVLPPIEEKPRNNIPPPRRTGPQQNAAPRNNLLERLFSGTGPLDKDYLKPTIPITHQKLFADKREDLKVMKNSNSSLSSRISLPKLPGYESAEQSFDYSMQFENSFLDNKVMNTTFTEDKENKNVLNFMNMRSPLKKIKVYGHQRDTLVAHVDKEANYLQEIIQKSPQNSPNIRRFILENNAY